ncbi:MAG: hypothetical protein NTV79_02590, partial [Candidatus Aureabacteria bacterium]|nr:hypothetical protein [Candidatus Auribacterota bacterium]
MFWKNVETASPPGRSSWSITVRLAALYALTTFALLLIATVFLYAMLERYLDNKNQQFVAGEVRVLCEVLREGSKEDRWELLDREIKGEAGRNPFARYYIRILETSGRELFTTPRMDGLLPPACFPPPGASQGPPEIRKYTAPGGLPYLLAASEALEGRSGKYPRIIQVALDTSPEAILLADYRRKALVVLLLGIVFPAAAGWAVARRGLRP